MNNEDFFPKIQRIFQKLAFLELENEKKSTVAKQMVEYTYTDRLYWWEMLLSGIIATYGLLQNSVAVIIGAMLVAPLLRPLYGIAFGIASGQRRHMGRAVRQLFFSMILAIGIGYIAGTLAPIHIQTPEMLARTRPNFFDLIVAIASAVVAMLSLRYDRLTESVAGVAIAAALLPPMVLVGIELAYGEWIYAQGALILCITNLLAIMFIGVSLMVMYGFSSQVDRHWSTVRLFSAMGFMLIIISIPLFNSLVQITEQYFIENKIEQYITTTIQELQPEAKIQDIIVRFPIGQEISIQSSLRLPEGNTIFNDTLNRLENGLVEEIGQDISLDFDIIRSVSALSREDVIIVQTPEELLQDRFEIYFGEVFQATNVRLVSWKNIGNTIQLVVYTTEKSILDEYVGQLQDILQKTISSDMLIDLIVLQDQDFSQIESSFSKEKNIYLLLVRRILDANIISVDTYIEEDGYSQVNVVLQAQEAFQEMLEERIRSELRLYDESLRVSIYFIS